MPFTILYISIALYNIKYNAVILIHKDDLMANTPANRNSRTLIFVAS